jgi:adenylate kinase family enzyme
LAPPELTSKYINERLFGVGATSGQVRVLVDGFPRDVDRWQRFKEMAKDVFKPNENTFLIVLHISVEAAWARYELRARPGDDFEGRFEQYERNEREVSDAMVKDGVLCLDVGVGEPSDPDPFEVVAEFLAERMDEWAASY